MKLSISENDLSQSQVINWLNSFYLDRNFDAIRDLYSCKSFPEILAVGRKELCHSSFLAWLLNTAESHGLRQFPILQFLKIVVTRAIQQNVKTPLRNYISEIFNESISFSQMTVNREICIKGGRPDIEICCYADEGGGYKSLNIVIENKVYAPEGGKQTLRYASEYGKDNKGLNVFVFLTPKSSELLNLQDRPSCKSDIFVEINYQDILENILEPALDKTLSDRARFIIKEYIRCLGMPISDIDNNNMKSQTIMATSIEVSKMLADFWSKNENLISAAMVTISDDPNQDPEVRKKVQELLNAKSSAEKDKTHYEFSGTVFNGKNAILVGVLSFLIRQNISISIINEKWKDFLNIQEGTLDDFPKTTNYEWTISTHIQEYTSKELLKELHILKRKGMNLLYSADDFKIEVNKREKSSVLIHDYSELKIVDNIYFYYNQWGWKNIDYFLKFYKDSFKGNNYPEIKIKSR